MPIVSRDARWTNKVQTVLARKRSRRTGRNTAEPGSSLHSTYRPEPPGGGVAEGSSGRRVDWFRRQGRRQSGDGEIRGGGDMGDGSRFRPGKTTPLSLEFLVPLESLVARKMLSRAGSAAAPGWAFAARPPSFRRERTPRLAYPSARRTGRTRRQRSRPRRGRGLAGSRRQWACGGPQCRPDSAIRPRQARAPGRRRCAISATGKMQNKYRSTRSSPFARVSFALGCGWPACGPGPVQRRVVRRLGVRIRGIQAITVQAIMVRPDQSKE